MVGSTVLELQFWAIHYHEFSKMMFGGDFSSKEYLQNKCFAEGGSQFIFLQTHRPLLA